MENSDVKKHTIFSYLNEQTIMKINAGSDTGMGNNIIKIFNSPPQKKKEHPLLKVLQVQ